MDSTRARLALTAIVAAVMLSAPAMAADFTTDAAGAPHARGDVDGLASPVLRLLGLIGVPVEAPKLPHSIALARSREAREVVFPVDDDGLGVYLEVRGRVEFERAQVRMADGAEREIDLRGAARGNGLYELCAFGGTTRVEAVRTWMRARSAEAQVGVRLGR